jgi:hypothetical protein
MDELAVKQSIIEEGQRDQQNVLAKTIIHV